MVASLLAMLSGGTSCFVAPVSHPDMSCCGPACPCPTGEVCDEFSLVAQDRLVGHAQQKVFHPAGQSLYSLDLKRDSFSTKSVKLAARYTQPPSFFLGSPPQAQLRIWII
jgi:hypothetical protein